MDLLLTVEATHSTILYFHLRFALLGLLAVFGIYIDIIFADLALGLTIEDAIPTLSLCVAAPLFLLPHLPKFLQLNDLILLRPAVLVTEVFNQTPLVFIIVVFEFYLLCLFLDLVKDYLNQYVCLIFI